MAESPDRSSSIDETSISPLKDPHHIRQNSLEKKLAQRPDPKELKDRHILLDINAAPALQAAALELERQRATDSLKRGLEHRPEREDLIERNILPSSTAAPSLLASQRELEKQMKVDTLKEKISHRPNPSDLVKEGILQEDPTSPVKEKGEESEADKLYKERMEEEYAKREGGA